MRLRGPGGIVVEAIAYEDKTGHPVRCYRVRRHGTFVAEYSTTGELAKVVGRADLAEDHSCIATPS